MGETTDAIFENLQPRRGGKPRVAAPARPSVIVRDRILTGPLTTDLCLCVGDSDERHCEERTLPKVEPAV